MRKAIRLLLRKTFDLREGEEQRVLLMQLNIFLIISTLLILKPAVNGLFLSKIGVERLPIAFILVAIFAAVVSTLYARILGRISLHRILLITLSSSVFLFIVFGFLLRLNIVEGWVLYAFYVWTSIFAVLTASQFWILANVVFNAREAKRLFGFIGAGAIAGGIFGGYLTTALAESVGSESLPFVAAGLLFFCIPISNFIWKKSVLPVQTTFQRRKKISKTQHPFRIISQSRHLTYLAGIVGISAIVAKLVDYQFSAIASAKIPDPDELTSFFGFWFSTFNVVSLGIQLLLTRKVVGTLGVGTSLFFLPVGILLGAVLVFFIPELWAAIFIKMSDGSLKQSINKAAVELLALPIPAEIKNQTKTFIDVFVDSMATGIGGLILIFLVSGLGLSSRFISLMIAVLIAVWIFFVYRVRKEYLRTFKLKMEGSKEDTTDRAEIQDVASVLEGWRRMLESNSERKVLKALHKMKERPDDRFFEDFKKLLDHPSDLVKAEALNNLYFLKEPISLDLVDQLSHAHSQALKIAAFEYLIQHSPAEIQVVMEKYLNDSDHRVQAAALVCLAKESRDNPTLKTIFQLEKRIIEQIYILGNLTDTNRKRFHKIGLLKMMGLSKMPGFFLHIEQLLGDEDERVIQQAILSAGDTLHPHFIPFLISFLSKSSCQKQAIAALTNYGKEILKELFQYTQKEESDLKVVRAIPLVMRNFGNQEAADLLFELLPHSDPRVRLTTLRALNYLRINYTYLDFHRKKIWKGILEEARLYQDTLSVLYVQMKIHESTVSSDKEEIIKTIRKDLVSLLEKRLDHNLERIFRLLGLKYPPDDIISIFQSIQSQKEDLRLNALEYLDNLLEPSLKKVLIPIIETALLDTVSEDVIRTLDLHLPSEKECYQLLLTREDEEIKRVIKKLQKYL